MCNIECDYILDISKHCIGNVECRYHPAVTAESYYIFIHTRVGIPTCISEEFYSLGWALRTSGVKNLRLALGGSELRT